MARHNSNSTERQKICRAEAPAAAGRRGASETSAKSDGETRCGWQTPALPEGAPVGKARQPLQNAPSPEST